MSGDTAWMPRAPLRAIFWDLDGTLAHTLPDLADSVNETMSGIGYPACGETLTRSWIGGGVENLVARALTHHLGAKPDVALLTEAMALFHIAHEKNNGRRARVYPGLAQLLAKQRDRGRHLACITNKAERYTLPLLDRLELSKYFALVVCGDTTAARKPDPLPLQHALTQLRLVPPDVVHIGDSSNDVLAARAAGIRTIGVSYGYSRGDMTPDRLAGSTAELRSLLN